MKTKQTPGSAADFSVGMTLPGTFENNENDSFNEWQVNAGR